MLKFQSELLTDARIKITSLINRVQEEAESGNCFALSIKSLLENTEWQIKPFLDLSESDYMKPGDGVEARRRHEILSAYIADPENMKDALFDMKLLGFVNIDKKLIAINTERLPESQMMGVLVHEANHAYLTKKILHKNSKLETFYLEYYAFLSERIYAGRDCSPTELIKMAKSICKIYGVKWAAVKQERDIWLSPSYKKILPHVPKALAMEYLLQRVPELFIKASKPTTGILYAKSLDEKSASGLRKAAYNISLNYNIAKTAP
ncbi:MAG: hypothetical protein CMF48_00620 [Legionellales bacterium]|nr:hypothetical protein [Legionellales bacterium]|tara:strand:- start:417 stop:1208 length:792 start_codon:yes stop_codon:yes gene_type:complete